MRLAAAAGLFLLAGVSTAEAAYCEPRPDPVCVHQAMVGEAVGAYRELVASDKSPGAERPDAYEIETRAERFADRLVEAGELEEAIQLVGSVRNLATAMAVALRAADSNPAVLSDPRIQDWIRAGVEALAPDASPDGPGREQALGWEDGMALAQSAGMQTLVESQLRAAARTVRDWGRAAPLSPDRSYFASKVVLLLARSGELAEAESLLPIAEGAKQNAHARVELARILAGSGHIDRARRLVEGVAPEERQRLEPMLVSFEIQFGDFEAVLASIGTVGPGDAASVGRDLAEAGETEKALRLASALDPVSVWSSGTIRVAVIRKMLGKGDLEAAARTAAEVNEVGRRATADALVAFSAARAGNREIALSALSTIDLLRRAEVDPVEVASAQILARFARLYLADTVETEEGRRDVQERIEKVPEAAEDALAAMSSWEDQLELRVGLAAFDMAAGEYDRAVASLAEVYGENPDDLVLLQVFAAGAAYALGGPRFGEAPVRRALAAIEQVEDRGMRTELLAELSARMSRSPI